MHVALDATPLLGVRTGVGQYVHHLIHALASREDVQVTLTAFTWRGRLKRLSGLPQNVCLRSPRVPARLLRTAWQRVDVPWAELLSGRVEIFHGTNFTLPPLRRAAGVLTVHDLAFLLHPDTVDDASRSYRILVPRGLKRARIVVTPSLATARDVHAAYGFPLERVVVTPLGVDAAWAAATPASARVRATYGVPERYFLFVGTLEPRKNLADLLAAHRIASRDEPELPPLVVIGPPGWGDVRIPESDITAGRVIRPGYVPHDTLRSLVAGALALALPSRYEGFGLPALEAMACGTEVIASDLPVLREVTGDLARYVPVGAVEELASTLIAVQREPADPHAAERRRAWAATFTWERCAERTVEAYRRALLD